MVSDTELYTGTPMLGVTWVVRAGKNGNSITCQTDFLMIEAALRFADYLRTMRKIPFVVIDGVVY